MSTYAYRCALTQHNEEDKAVVATLSLRAPERDDLRGLLESIETRLIESPQECSNGIYTLLNVVQALIPHQDSLNEAKLLETELREARFDWSALESTGAFLSVSVTKFKSKFEKMQRAWAKMVGNPPCASSSG